MRDRRLAHHPPNWKMTLGQMAPWRPEGDLKTVPMLHRLESRGAHVGVRRVHLGSLAPRIFLVDLR